MNSHSDFIPYYAVIFTSLKNNNDAGYSEMSARMHELAQLQTGYLGFESARNETGISVSYWKTLDDIRNWKLQSEHLFAQQQGREKWYRYYKIRICKVEREYEFTNTKI